MSYAGKTMFFGYYLALSCLPVQMVWHIVDNRVPNRIRFFRYSPLSRLEVLVHLRILRFFQMSSVIIILVLIEYVDNLVPAQFCAPFINLSRRLDSHSVYFSRGCGCRIRGNTREYAKFRRKLF